jgi:hypothetical protein
MVWVIRLGLSELYVDTAILESRNILKEDPVSNTRPEVSALLS